MPPASGLAMTRSRLRLLAHRHRPALAHLDVAAAQPEALGRDVALDDAEAQPARALLDHPALEQAIERVRGAAAVQRGRDDEQADVPDVLGR